MCEEHTRGPQGDGDGSRREEIEAPVCLDLLVRELMAKRRAQLAEDDVDPGAEEDADAPPVP